MRRKRKRSRYSSGLSFYEDKNTVNTSRIVEALLWVSYTVIALFLAVICFRSFGFRIGVLGGSMEPGIVQGQNVLVNKLAYRMSTPQRGDVVAFYPGGDDKMHPSVKRVVAIPGDSVRSSSCEWNSLLLFGCLFLHLGGRAGGGYGNS